MNHYFIIRSGDHGTRVDGPFSETVVQERIKPNEHGETYYGMAPIFLSEIPDSGVPEGAIVILEGVIIVPTPIRRCNCVADLKKDTTL